MSVKVIIRKYAFLILIFIGLSACNDNDVGEILTYQDIATLFSGDSSGSISADGTTATGTITVSGGSIVAQTDSTQTYGSFSIDSSGSWTYTVNSSSNAVLALNDGETVTEEISIVSTGGNTSTITITITGVNDDAVLGGDNSGGSASNSTAAITGTLTLTGDVDNVPDSFVVQTNNATTYGIFSITEDGVWTYSIDADNSDVMALTSTSDPLTDVISVNTADGLTASVTISITGPAVNTAATFAGDITSSIDAGDTTTLMGTVSVTDPDAGENVLVAQTSGALTYGSFAVGTDGAWSYVLDNANADVAALEVGSTLTETAAFTSADGTAGMVTITINGIVATGTNKFAEIIDTMGSANGNDTGELRYALGGDGPLAAGRVEAKIRRLDDTLGDGDAFLTLFNSSTNNAGAILDLRIRDSSFGVRDSVAGDAAAGGLPLTLDAFMDVVVTWEYPGGDTSVGVSPNITVEVDGTSIGPFTTTSAPTGGVTHVAFRFGDNGGARPATGIVSVDDFAIYSDTAGTTEVFSDDFESYADGDSLDTDNAASPYHSNTSEATVGEEGAATGGPGTPGNKIAEIIDTMGSANGNDTGELRYALGGDGPLAAGRVEAKIRRLDDTLGDGDAFLTLFNSSTNNAGAILDLRIRDSSFGVRDSVAGDAAAGGLPLTLDAFMDVVVTWEYPGGDTSVGVSPNITVEVDGTSIGPFTTTSAPTGGVTHVAFRFGDNGGARPATGIVSVDDFAIYSDTAGTTEVFSDDFESYADGDSLDTDNAASPYHSNTSEATVGVEQ